ncbi:hypothetical protein [Peribacillus asahii]|uniref:hypothetical protein n=1 Tax=Peribacillus asahii TaxID=228899 RepID=UPI00207A8665|nr:hypothetical protein [Peribacillus asahii]USK87456.1 hypothetical protein LIT35_09570 [Peribacillus asahii]
MYQHRNSHPNYPVQSMPEFVDSQQITQRITMLENQLGRLIQLMEQNNKLLRKMEQQQNRVVTSGGGSVIVRM